MFTKDVLAGKVAVVPGAGSGIGAGVGESLARAGAAVVVSYHSSGENAEHLLNINLRGAFYPGPK